MHLGNLKIIRLVPGLAALAVVLALVMVVLAVGTNSDAPSSVSAANPTAQPTLPNIPNDGDLSGVVDIVVGIPGDSPVTSGVGLFYCIVKNDHNSANNEMRAHLQCNIDVADAGVAQPDPADAISPPTWHDTCEALSLRTPPECVIGVGSSDGQLNNPSETGADALAGPPPPPPYTNLAPSIGVGDYYPVGANDSVCGVGLDCTVTTVCFSGTGPILGSTGPNIMSRSVVVSPYGGATGGATVNGVDRVSGGTVEIWYNQSNTSCQTYSPKGLPNLSLDLESIAVANKLGLDVNPNPAPWRDDTTGRPGATTINFDGDACTDAQELDPKLPGKCGDDPQNPSDSFADPNNVNLDGIYDLLVTILPGDCTDDQCTAEKPGVYFFCRVDLQHDGTDPIADPSDGGTNVVVARPYCYSDSVGMEVNPEGYPPLDNAPIGPCPPTCGPEDIFYTGDGMAGAPPPGPQAPAASLNFAYGDVDEKHSELVGLFNPTTNNFELAGCVLDLDGQGAIGNAYIILELSAHQLPSIIDIYGLQPDPECAGSPVPPLLFDDVAVTSWQANPNKAKGYDQDDDGIPTARELEDDTNDDFPGDGKNPCGRRDPYNQNDYYDVSIPRDGVIDLPNDILGVILHFAPGGYAPGDENWDRPPTMTGAGVGSTWNRGSPDGVIDLPNDILGVILQFNPGGCS